MAKTSLALVIYILRVLTFVLLLISLILLVTNSETVYELQLRFQDFQAFRYMAVVIVLGIAYGLLHFAFSIRKAASGAEGNLLFDFYGEKIMSYVLASGAAAGLAVTVDYQNNFDSLKVFSEFYEKAYASSSLLLLAFVLTAALSAISSFICTPEERM